MTIVTLDEGPTWFTAVMGTDSWEDIPLRMASVNRLWWKPGSPFMRTAAEWGMYQLVHPTFGPFTWDTELGGVFWKKRDERGWQSAGDKLRQNIELQNIPYDWRNFIAHSWGGAVLLFAIAQGLEVRNVVFVGVPVAVKLMPVAAIARKRIHYWHSIVDRDDRIQAFGSLFAGPVREESGRLVRSYPGTDTTDTLTDVDHSKVLYDPAYYPYWTQNNWHLLLKQRRVTGGM